MSTRPRWYQTTAIDYPNSRPHIGTAFEKLGADVQARYRRMEGYDVCFLMGNDENTLKVADRAKSLGQDVQHYCDDMARQFREVWDTLGISYDVFIQTSHQRHKECCKKFIQKVYENGYIYRGEYSGWYCNGCEEFKSDKIHAENQGNCPMHRRPLSRRSEPCYYFKLSAFQEKLLKFLNENPDFVQPESRRNEMIGFIEAEGLEDLNISRHGKEWGIPLPFDENFTIYVWFDALLTYITGIGYGDDQEMFQKYWPADIHFIGKDITRFHSHIWPAMLWAADIEPPRKIFSHGFVNHDGAKMGKSLGNIVEPLDIIKQSSVDAYRYYFMRECPYPSDGDYSGQRFEEVYESDLVRKLGNLLSRCSTLMAKSYSGVLKGTAGRTPSAVSEALDLPEVVQSVREAVESCRYNIALQTIVQQLLIPSDAYLENHKPWSMVKSDPAAAQEVLFNATQMLRIVSILLKPFIPTSAKAIYDSFNFSQPWKTVRYSDAAMLKPEPQDLRLIAEVVDGKIKPLFPRLGSK